MDKSVVACLVFLGAAGTLLAYVLLRPSHTSTRNITSALSLVLLGFAVLLQVSVHGSSIPIVLAQGLFIAMIAWLTINDLRAGKAKR